MAGMRNCRKLPHPFRANIEGRCLKCGPIAMSKQSKLIFF